MRRTDNPQSVPAMNIPYNSLIGSSTPEAPLSQGEELVNRLRWYAALTQDPNANHLLCEAADAIASLIAERDKLKESGRSWFETADKLAASNAALVERVSVLEKENTKLKAILDKQLY